ncbi:MAG: type II toxin-antitoxin system PemK/MazF family toxin [Lachnospiraceae bacterium]|jgi:mRNA-degrading endonuclease toxin of MazEF toxin-antitoxin module|nr:type II toxin-antitoxin system PemK/MazF family toxin [Lachnospiraceae bacterium]
MSLISVNQRDIIKVEGIKDELLVVSKNIFNINEETIVCPIVRKTIEHPLHMKLEHNEIMGVIECEQMKYIDLRTRGYKKIGEIGELQFMYISDAIQSIFEYY